MKKSLYIIVFFLSLIAQKAIADDVTFTASAPSAVAIGDQFRLSYTITTQNVREFRAPSMNGFDVLMGPSRSQQQSVQIINGKQTSTSSITFTYILLATKEGEFSLQGATVVANGENKVSNSLKIKVLPKEEGGAASSTNASSDDNGLFILSTVNKTQAYEQEAILLTYKIYTNVDLRRFDNVKLPDFKGFQSQEVEQPNDLRWDLEHYKGHNYRTAIYRQFILFPQQAGKLTIDGARFDAAVKKASEITDPFDAFFNHGQSGYTEIKKVLNTPKIIVDVKQLPNGKPEGFSGGVGDFSISSSITGTDVKCNDAITLKVVISGEGNMKLISNPVVKFPDDFEIYDPKVDNQFHLTSAGLSGNQVIEYLAIPRNPGTFNIPPVKFSYFDIKSGSYKTLTTEEYHLNVAKGDGTTSQVISNYNNKEDLKILNEDIRFIKQNDVTLHKYDYMFFNTWKYWLCYIIPFLAFVGFFIFYRHQIIDNANVAKMKTKKANKIATKRMKQAEKLMTEGKDELFYDEVLRTLWGYVSDKLNIPVSMLSKGNIKEKFSEHGVDEQMINDFCNTLDECEYARFAPGDANQNMDNVYNSSIKIISKMENSIGNKH